MAEPGKKEAMRAKLKVVSNDTGIKKEADRELEAYQQALRAAGLTSRKSEDGLEFGSESALELIPVDELVPGFIPAVSVGALIGAPNAGKTFLCHHVLKLLAEGGSFNGQRVDQGGALYIGGEGKQGHRRRMAALYMPMGEQEAKRLDVNPDAFGHREIAKSIAADLSNFPIGMPSDRACARIYKIACEYKQRLGRFPALLALDHFGLLLEKGSSRSADEAVEPLYAELRKLAELMGCTIWILVHTTKNGDTYSGSVTQEGAWDFAYMVEKDGTGDDATHTLVNKKQRDGIATASGSTFKLVTRILGETPKGLDYTSAFVSFNRFGAVEADDDNAADIIAAALADGTVKTLDDLVLRFLDGKGAGYGTTVARLTELIGLSADRLRDRSKVRGDKTGRTKGTTKKDGHARRMRVERAVERLQAAGQITVELVDRDSGGAERVIRRVIGVTLEA
ncbi:AAA family ATPase [Rhodopseudomonas sp. P2A-2r]|uniref:AAA family ATPase n=1 Tax=Rhodopseudomonas sp. P2A-2r TaxID=2991972 RepID=UPI0022345CBF|nr:AAA family ATPase [Rhodopseudomonas sp. P2A-2r]UZE47012.1 AAA family ATPase [Rhodopseudomonas sp. P2A-2r]